MASHAPVRSELARSFVAFRTVVAHLSPDSYPPPPIPLLSPSPTPERRSSFCRAAFAGRAFHLCVSPSIHPSIHASGGVWDTCRDADGQEDVLVIDLLSLKDGLLLPTSLSAILCGPFCSPDVLKLGGWGGRLLICFADLLYVLRYHRMETKTCLNIAPGSGCCRAWPETMAELNCFVFVSGPHHGCAQRPHRQPVSSFSV